ncbi:DgyrCDS9407 [Dimorphilus gyrociliatus]|uniref:DgyrCDS9407 n=1 Tax=Dimorphilus gyrociliatus TaxID=2664684 RepID=A0A7I8VZ38_9ANNE|nr:DgyrCDS9407 [Dimorphilus gyrociliatus]
METAIALFIFLASFIIGNMILALSLFIPLNKYSNTQEEALHRTILAMAVVVLVEGLICHCPCKIIKLVKRFLGREEEIVIEADQTVVLTGKSSKDAPATVNEDRL